MRTTGKPENTPGFWSRAPYLRQLSWVAIKILAIFATSASVERSFSAARAVTDDFQMAQLPDTICTHVMIKAD
jgi:hypothetical protein